MSDVTFRSDESGGALSAALAPVRAAGGVHARFLADGSRTAVASVVERGGYRLARPSTFAPHLEALQVNTGGGIAGGDRLETVYEIGRGADVVHTTSSGERIYRSEGASAKVDIRIVLDPDARLDWLPQQTIVYAGARLERRIEIDVSSGSRLLMLEITTFGRPESAERAAIASLNDQWRVRRDGRLIYAEAIRLSGELGEMLDRPAVAGGARASALLLYLARDASDHVDGMRRTLECNCCETGVSAWNGLLAARALSRRPGDLIAAFARSVPALSGRAMPRVWAT